MILKTLKNKVKEIILVDKNDKWNMRNLNEYLEGPISRKRKHLDKLSRRFRKNMIIYAFCNEETGRCYEIYNHPWGTECYYKMFFLSALLINSKKYKIFNGVKYYFEDIDVPFEDVYNIHGVCKSLIWKYYV